MAENAPTEMPKRRQISPGLASLVTLLVMFFSPIAAMIYWGWGFQIQIVGNFWTIYGDSFNPFRFEAALYMLIGSTYVTFPRYAVPVLIYRFYKGQTTLRRVLISTAVAELYLPGFFIITMIPSIIFGGYFPGLIIPIPTFALTVIILLKKFPRSDEYLIWSKAPEHQPWWIEEEMWWEKEVSKKNE